MNPNEPMPSFELPTPVSQSTGEAQHSPERPAVGAEQPARPSFAQPSSLPTQMAVSQPQAVPTQPPVAMPADPGQLMADDTDLIEKEWVQRAKQIVAATKDDPYRQNKELSKVKADYLKKRYNKDIKVEGA